MKKYLAIIPVLAVAFALTVAPALAGNRNNRDRHHHNNNEDKVSVENNNEADVDNNIEAKSNTGKNEANNNGRLGRIDTGRADSLAEASTTANENRTSINSRGFDRVEVDNENDADVENNVEAKSNTGYNEANNNGTNNQIPFLSLNGNNRGHHNHHTPQVRENNGRGVINTGDAISTASAVNLLNSNVTRIR